MTIDCSLTSTVNNARKVKAHANILLYTVIITGRRTGIQNDDVFLPLENENFKYKGSYQAENQSPGLTVSLHVQEC